MSYRVHFCPSFDRSIKRLERHFPHVKDDVRIAIGLLTKEPRTGVVIPGSSGIRKLRVRNTDQTRGKIGGYRLVYYVTDSPVPTIYLLLLYSKSDKSDVTSQELKQLLNELMEEIGC